jgi:predicted transcriptional regulator
MSITIELPDDLSADVVRRAERMGKTANEFIAEALRRQISIERFRETRTRLSPYGDAAGLQSDEAVFAAIS